MHSRFVPVMSVPLSRRETLNVPAGIAGLIANSQTGAANDRLSPGGAM